MSSITLSRGATHPPGGMAFPAIAAPRSVLLLGTALALVVASALGDPQPMMAADPDLARLLRGMALVKSVLVLAAVGVLWWRLRQPVPAGHGLAYLIGAWLAAGATMLIWQLSFIAPAALAFHAGELLLLLTAWSDGHRPA